MNTIKLNKPIYLHFISYDLQVADFYIYNKYIKNKHSSVNIVEDGLWGDIYITTTYNVILRNKWLIDILYKCDKTPYHNT